MNLKEVSEAYKKAIERKFTIEECVNIMAPLGCFPEMIASITDLVCDQPDSSKREDLCFPHAYGSEEYENSVNAYYECEKCGHKVRYSEHCGNTVREVR